MERTGPLLVSADRHTEALQSEQKGIRHRGFRGDVLKIDAQMHDGLRDLRTDAANNAIRSHQPRRGDGL